MIGKRFSKRWILTWGLWLVLFIPASLFVYRYDQAKEDKERHQKIQQEQEEARAEALRRNAEKTPVAVADAPDPRFRVPPTDPVNRPTPETETEQQPGEGPSVAVVTSGPYKGMTVEAAKAAEKQKLPEIIAAAEKRRQWELRKAALKKRWRANRDRLTAIADAALASADAELEAVLSVYALMSPEQLEYAREEALKTMPAEKVEAFFDELANHRSTKTPEQLTKDAQDILKSREARRIARREYDVERERIAIEEEELKRTEPPIPW